MEIQMQVEIPMDFYNIFAEQAEFHNCTVDRIICEIIRKFLEKSG